MKAKSLAGCARLDSRGRLSLRELFRLVSTLSQMASVSRAVLREIFDESAYQRFLDRSRLESSPDAYAIFLQENEQARSRRPRCC
jgi:hypothetical protein